MKLFILGFVATAAARLISGPTDVAARNVAAVEERDVSTWLTFFQAKAKVHSAKRAFGANVKTTFGNHATGGASV